MALALPSTILPTAQPYESLLRKWLEVSDDATLAAAERLGASLVARNVGLLDVVAVHQSALSRILESRDEDAALPIIGAAAVLQAACLRPFAAALSHHNGPHGSVDTLRLLNQQLEEKVKRIAHALHDEAGQLIASVYLNVAEIASDLPHRGRRRLEELRALLDRVDDELRRLAHQLRPTILDDLGVLPACQFLGEAVATNAGVRVNVHGDAGGRLPPATETAVYRVVQEALANATRHGHAHAISVTFARINGSLQGTIHDDGVGFDASAVLTGTNTTGLGVMGMRERLAAVGGTFTIASQPGIGTSIQFEVPAEN
jgi:signal transduction histidine kinase